MVRQRHLDWDQIQRRRSRHLAQSINNRGRSLSCATRTSCWPRAEKDWAAAGSASRKAGLWLASVGASDSRNCDPIAIDANQYRFVYRDLCCRPHRSHLQYCDERIQRPNVPTTEPKSVLSLSSKRFVRTRVDGPEALQISAAPRSRQRLDRHN